MFKHFSYVTRCLFKHNEPVNIVHLKPESAVPIIRYFLEKLNHCDLDLIITLKSSECRLHNFAEQVWVKPLHE